MSYYRLNKNYLLNMNIAQFIYISLDILRFNICFYYVIIIMVLCKILSFIININVINTIYDKI